MMDGDCDTAISNKKRVASSAEDRIEMNARARASDHSAVALSNGKDIDGNDNDNDNDETYAAVTAQSASAVVTPAISPPSPTTVETLKKARRTASTSCLGASLEQDKEKAHEQEHEAVAAHGADDGDCCGAEPNLSVEEEEEKEENAQPQFQPHRINHHRTEPRNGGLENVEEHKATAPALNGSELPPCNNAVANTEQEQELPVDHHHDSDNDDSDDNYNATEHLESALYRIAHMEKLSSSIRTSTQPQQEPLPQQSEIEHELLTASSISSSHDDKSWIEYRVGHAGDAPILASYYRKSHGHAVKSTSSTKTTEGELDSSTAVSLSTHPATYSSKTTNTVNFEDNNQDQALEVWLADGLGDEENPPCVFALLADIISIEVEKEKEGSSISDNPDPDPDPDHPHHRPMRVRLGAACLLTQSSSSSSPGRGSSRDCNGGNRKKCIQVLWTYAENDRLRQSLWARLAALGILTSCELIVQ